jgi:hypothetical protein
MSYSVSCFLIQLPVAYYIVGRRAQSLREIVEPLFQAFAALGVVGGAT